MITALLFLLPTLIRLDLVFSCPAVRLSTAEWEITVKRGNEYTHAGLEAQQDWLLAMVMLYTPFMFLAAIVNLR